MVRTSLALLWLATALACEAPPNVRGSTGPHQVVFATSSKQTGDLGGLAAADDICAERAADAGLAGSFRAWLSTPESPAADRLSHASIPYARIDGIEVAADWDDLVDGSLSAPIDRDENGDEIGGDVWTGTLASGEPADDTCAGFVNPAVTGLCGSSNASDASWTDNIRPPCTSALRLYCVQE